MYSGTGWNLAISKVNHRDLSGQRRSKTTLFYRCGCGCLLNGSSDNPEIGSIVRPFEWFRLILRSRRLDLGMRSRDQSSCIALNIQSSMNHITDTDSKDTYAIGKIIVQTKARQLIKCLFPKKHANHSGTTSSSQLSLPLVIKTHISITTRIRRRRINHLFLDFPNSVSIFGLARRGGFTERGRRMLLQR